MQSRRIMDLWADSRKGSHHEVGMRVWLTNYFWIFNNFYIVVMIHEHVRIRIRQVSNVWYRLEMLFISNSTIWGSRRCRCEWAHEVLLLPYLPLFFEHLCIYKLLIFSGNSQLFIASLLQCLFRAFLIIAARQAFLKTSRQILKPNRVDKTKEIFSITTNSACAFLFEMQGLK